MADQASTTDLALGARQDRHVTAVSAERLRWRCDPEWLGFASTAEVTPLVRTVGQERGLDAIALGLGLTAEGFNVYVAGPPGSGRTSSVRATISPVAAARPSPPDRCYLHNFDEPSEPIAVRLEAGQGPVLGRDLDELIRDCQREIPRVFEGEQYQHQRTRLSDQLRAQREGVFEQIREVAERLGFAVDFEPAGVATVPLLEPGKPLTPEGFELLPDARKAELREHGRELARQIDEAMLIVRRAALEAQERLRALDREAVGFAVGHLLDALRSKYADVQLVIQHLDRVQADLVTHLSEFGETAVGGPGPISINRAHDFDRYRANVLVSHGSGTGAPVVFEANPTFYNLLGRIDYRASLGAMSTDFRLVRAGALHRANGGYLVLQARDVLLSPFAWDALKRALRERELRIENLGEQFSAFPTATLKPAPIPLDVKIVLIGDPQTYMLLYGLDPDFSRLFKVKAQFGPYMERSPETIAAYAGFVSGRVQGRGLLPFTQDGVGRVVEYGARLANHQERLSTRLEAIDDLLVEADYVARAAGADQTHADHIDAAEAAQERRLNLLEDHFQREIDEGTIAIETHGAVVAQVNGLSVLELGDYAFARPSRITARVGPGEDGVVDIEREVKLSGPSHSKGVLILTGYLLEQYARMIPLALSAQLTFEQTYGEVDGDSASSAELYALLSGLADVPIRQGIAVTGSVNQRGEIQAVGGVTTKIEGFFAVCKAQWLDGQQGVIIPATNVRHLMLKQEVVDAVTAGRFHVWAVRDVDEGIQILTGVPTGERRPDGTFPTRSLHGRVQQRLTKLATRLTVFRRSRLVQSVTTRDGRAEAPTMA
jgi:predicted ATP-dependent protease